MLGSIKHYLQYRDSMTKQRATGTKLLVTYIITVALKEKGPLSAISKPATRHDDKPKTKRR
jgi:hypothetical protein